MQTTIKYALPGDGNSEACSVFSFLYLETICEDGVLSANPAIIFYVIVYTTA